MEVERFGGGSARQAHGVGAAEQPSYADRLTDRMPIDRLGREPRSVGGQIDRERDQPQRYPLEARHAALSPATVFALGTDVAPPSNTSAIAPKNITKYADLGG